MTVVETCGQVTPGAVDLVSLLAVYSERIKHVRLLAVNDSGPDPDHPTVRRYIGGQHLYFGAARPWECAAFVVDNCDFTSVPEGLVVLLAGGD